MSEKYKIEMSIKAKEDIKDLLIYIKNELRVLYSGSDWINKL